MTNFGTGPLTKLDERVLEAISGGRARRLRDVRSEVYRREFASGGRGPSVEDVLGVLRGFEHLGKASGRGGWWRAL